MADSATGGVGLAGWKINTTGDWNANNTAEALGASKIIYLAAHDGLEVDGELRVQDWGFDAWGGAFGDIPYAADDAVPTVIGEQLGLDVRSSAYGVSEVVDENMVECPPGVVGEIVIRGEQTLLGYFRNEEGTRKSYEGGWFHSGDMAKRDEEGFFYIVDRMKDMILTGGENVYSREVEEVIYTHPAVSEAAVIGDYDTIKRQLERAIDALGRE